MNRKPVHGDRVRWPDGRTGTVIDTHEKASPMNLGVLPDTGPRSQTVVSEADVEVAPGPARDCKRCGDPDHTAPACRKD